MKAQEIRQEFKKFFASQKHEVVASSSLIPYGDETILFTNAGMNQFKKVFLGREKRHYKRAVSVQKCMRVSGKHNDLENVGRTTRHHTFFEMLGNFSFGDYFKKEAIEFGWNFLTKTMGIDPARLWVTVYEKDDEAKKYWLAMKVLSAERILGFGEKDNFWAMGEIGPCGPCSEIHYDFGENTRHGGQVGCGRKDCKPNCECGRFVELWNLVFIQFDRQGDGSLLPLPAPCVDTGMGLERLTAIKQGVYSNYETDLFSPIISSAEEIVKKKFSDKTQVSFNVVADHARALVFLISDGVTPSNEGRGYVLRKIMRRAMKHGRYLGREEPFLWRLAPTVVDIMAEEYPDLLKTRAYIETVCKAEEEKFSDTLSAGLNILEEIFSELEKKKTKVISGDEAFRLYDTYGFPLDLAIDIASDRGFSVDIEGYEKALSVQRETARRSWQAQAPAKAGEVYRKIAEECSSLFRGYETAEIENAKVLKIIKGEKEVKSLAEGEEGEIVLSETPFYATSGGQVGDTGYIVTDKALAEVSDTFKPVENLIVHKARVKSGAIREGDSVKAQADIERRRDIMANHTATHLLHSALRDALGEHIKQAGSLVAPDRLRFDFSHFKPIPAETLRAIEARINEEIRADKKLEIEIVPLDEALKKGAMALFGENYGEKVRMVSVPGFSRELCGGTHTETTGQIGTFLFTDERGIASGVRRVEAVTGRRAIEEIQRVGEILTNISVALNARTEEIIARIESLEKRLEEYQKENENLKLAMASGASSSGANGEESAKEINGVRVLAKEVHNIDESAIRTLSDRLLQKLGSGVVVIGSKIDEKALILVSVSKDLSSRIRAGDIIKKLAPLVDGSGGGKPTLAQAGGRSPEKLASALSKSYSAVEECLKSAAPVASPRGEADKEKKV